MSVDTQRRRFLALGATATLTGLSGCSGATPLVGKRLEDDQRYDAESVNTVTVNGRNGEVQVRPTDGREVQVETVKQSGSVFSDLDDVSVDMTVENGEIRIETRKTGDGSWLGGLPSVDVSIGLPSGVALGELRTENGSVNVRGVETDAMLVTENGSISVHDVDGFISAETENGSVTIRGVAGIDKARTTNGSIEIDVPAIRGETTIQSENGGVTAALSPELNANVVARNERGEIKFAVSNFEAATMSEHRVEGTLGSGGPELLLATESGGIDISELR